MNPQRYSLARSLTPTGETGPEKVSQSSGSFSALPRLYYRTQELTGKEKIILASCGKLVFDDQPLKGI
jgi:hypothetical protein